MTPQRGQMAIQYMLLWGVIFAAVIALFFVSMDYLNNHYRTSQAESSLQSVAITANTVYNLRPGSEETISIDMPPGVESTAVRGKVILVNITGSAINNAQELYINTIPELIGNMPSEQGRHHVSVKVLNSTLVRIGDGLVIFTISPNPAAITDMPRLFTIFGDEFAQGLTLLLNGAEYPPGNYNYIDQNYITFFGTPGLLQQGTYIFAVQNPDGERSNNVTFTVT